MAVIYEETQDIIPETPFKILALMLIATDLFLLVCSFAGIVNGYWQFAIFTAITAAIIAICYFVKIRIVIDEEKIKITMLKKYEAPLTHVIDVKKGDIDIMRNYSEWGIKKVKFRNYTAPGIDGAVSVKMAGRLVLTMTTQNPDELYEVFYNHRRQD
ncbi:MAG: hypothetical protein MJZ21_05645 [archaeon]|nr:hypothetical protein [archaeon]